MGLRIELDESKCSGLGLGEAEAPVRVAGGDDGSRDLHRATPSDEHRAACEAAIASCPTEALRLVES